MKHKLSASIILVVVGFAIGPAAADLVGKPYEGAAILTEDEAEAYPYTHLLSAIGVAGTATKLPYSVAVTLDHGGCIVGPFDMRDNYGNPIFSLSAGADFPAGCDASRASR